MNTGKRGKCTAIRDLDIKTPFSPGAESLVAIPTLDLTSFWAIALPEKRLLARFFFFNVSQHRKIKGPTLANPSRGFRSQTLVASELSRGAPRGSRDQPPGENGGVAYFRTRTARRQPHETANKSASVSERNIRNERTSEQASALVESERRLSRSCPSTSACAALHADVALSSVSSPRPLPAPLDLTVYRRAYKPLVPLRPVAPPPAPHYRLRHPVYMCTLSRSHDSLARSSPSLAPRRFCPRTPAFGVGPRDTIDTAWSKRTTQPYHHPATPRFRFGRPGEGAPFARSLGMRVHICTRMYVFSRLPPSVFLSFSLTSFRDTVPRDTADPTRHGSRRGPTLSTLGLALFRPGKRLATNV